MLQSLASFAVRAGFADLYPPTPRRAAAMKRKQILIRITAANPRRTPPLSFCRDSTEISQRRNKLAGLDSGEVVRVKQAIILFATAVARAAGASGPGQ